jgi:hypothetical protein
VLLRDSAADIVADRRERTIARQVQGAKGITAAAMVSMSIQGPGSLARHFASQTPRNYSVFGGAWVGLGARRKPRNGRKIMPWPWRLCANRHSNEKAD